jgi:hypothetical protein
MTNEAIIQLLWQGYKAGKGFRAVETAGLHVVKKDFDEWVKDNCSHLLQKPEVTTEDGILTSKGTVYWHEWGCKASMFTKPKTGNCTCEGKHPTGSTHKSTERNIDGSCSFCGEPAGCLCYTR